MLQLFPSHYTFFWQDFDDWDDVGLNIPKPPALLQLFRNYSAALLSDKERLERIQDLVSSGTCYWPLRRLQPMGHCHPLSHFHRLSL